MSKKFGVTSCERTSLAFTSCSGPGPAYEANSGLIFVGTLGRVL